jgi:hypothetical protein
MPPLLNSGKTIRNQASGDEHEEGTGILYNMLSGRFNNGILST